MYINIQYPDAIRIGGERLTSVEEQAIMEQVQALAGLNIFDHEATEAYLKNRVKARRKRRVPKEAWVDQYLKRRTLERKRNAKASKRKSVSGGLR
ncbi:hypothetical protein AA14337_3136 [Acetobacter malorum DSM 14337]|uniref:30S ribosomal protein S21 n=1 Tax=Acetobacter malorum DSM 14337 TaxID=1307910 RepID=A0ABQ0PZV5_9PROT|nr:hypothetical protein [Acetobacter malorum]KXV05713.1 hypothetical protein AD930_11315 [Acetobacter malorum]GBQ85680.1 hypothetical protein AA14337_3136 [Acetobacter malorum DSM 14337]